MNKIRLDNYLVNNKLFETRNKSQFAIKNNLVKVNNSIININNFLVCEKDKVEIINKIHHISRGYLKLEKALSSFNLDISNMNCLDIGCSTGGFTQVLYENKANIIYSIDVGTNQFDKKILNDKILLYENTNFLDVDNTLFKHQINFITCDVSFISATKIINHICKIIPNNFKMVCLIKPQFELTKIIIDKSKGIIKDKKYHDLAISNIIACAKNNNLKFSKIIESPILGAKGGNKEFLIILERKF